VGDTGDIMLCDFSKYMAIDKGGIQSDVSIHVQFIYDESVFRFVYRFDGQPMLASAITPFSGGATLSHFVKLDERA
jgi:HK97 family phage major capsid protein